MTPFVHRSSIGLYILTLFSAVCLSCSLINAIDDECDSNNDCDALGAGLVCSNGLCIRESGSDGDGDSDGDSDTDTDADQDSPPLMPEDLLSVECSSLVGIDLEDFGEPISEDAILIGAIHPQSGDLALAGSYFLHATQMAVEELNRTGGLTGRPFIMIVCDSGGDADTVQSAAEHLAELGVKGVLGPFSSELAIHTFNQVYRDNDMLMITAGANSPIMETISAEGLIWSTSLPAKREATALAEHIIASERYNRIAVVNRDDHYGTGMREAFQDVYCTHSDCLDSDSYMSRVYDTTDLATSLSEVVGALVEFDPDVTIMLTYVDDGLGMVLTIANMESPLRSFIWNDAMADEIVFTQLELLTGGTDIFPILCQISAVTAAIPRGMIYDSFVLRYNARWDGEGLVPYTANYYDATYLLAYAYAAATRETDNPSGSDLAAAMVRLSDLSAPDIEAGTRDWTEGVSRLRSSESATIDYVGVGGDVDFVGTTGTVMADVEMVRLNVEERDVESVGIIYTIDDVYSPPDYSGVVDAMCEEVQP